jgi:hypothetical protein
MPATHHVEPRTSVAPPGLHDFNARIPLALATGRFPPDLPCMGHPAAMCQLLSGMDRAVASAADAVPMARERTRPNGEAEADIAGCVYIVRENSAMTCFMVLWVACRVLEKIGLSAEFLDFIIFPSSFRMQDESGGSFIPGSPVVELI